MSTISFVRWFALVLACAVPVADGFARQISFGKRERPRLGVGVVLIQTEFKFDGVCAPREPSESCLLVDAIDFSEPMYGIVFSRPGLMMSITRGTGDGAAATVEGEELLDASLSIWTELYSFGLSGPSRARVFIPAGIHSSYRKFSREYDGGKIDQFESTVVGIGAGVGAVTRSGPLRLSVWAMPIFGLASRSVGFGRGYSTVIEGDLEVAYGPITGRFGLLAGYGFRWQRWDLDDAGVSAVQSNQKYTGTQHGFRLGVTW